MRFKKKADKSKPVRGSGGHTYDMRSNETSGPTTIIVINSNGSYSYQR
jgi:hypothetical protein